VSGKARAVARRLLASAETEDVSSLCERAHVELLVLFGSGAHEESDPADVDLAVAFGRRVRGDLIGLLDELHRLTGFEGFDVLDLDRAGPLARERALVGGRILFEARPGLFANRQIAAIMERLDTDAMGRARADGQVSPREFDAGVVQTRIAQINRLLDDLQSMGDIDPGRLEDDRILRYAVERILSQVVELAVSVNGHVAATLIHESPKDYRLSFDLAGRAGMIAPDLAARLRPSVGLRNVVVPEYLDIDLALVSSAAHAALTDYREYVRGASAWLASR
jgi:uncharacterized protein YutE (UPF0331/DUF86 family)/predicted nucleotidyltransferase